MEREKLVGLVTAAQSGDQKAMNELFNAFYNDVYYFALKTVKNDEVACDVTQETFVEIIKTLGNLQEPAAFVTWMKQITYHQCTRYFKKKKDVLVDEDEEGATLFDTLQEDNAAFIPDEALDQDDFRKTIMAMLDELSEEQRAAVLLFYFDELPIKQIAEIQGVSENTVKSRLNYARKGIKKSVEDYEKKHNIKLHSVGVLPILLWLFKGNFAHIRPTVPAGVVAEGVSAATGVSVAVTTATTATTAATATGIGAAIAAIPVAAKVVAGIAAAVLTIGGGAAIILSNGDGDSVPAHTHAYAVAEEQAATCTADGQAVYTCSCGDTYTEALPAAHTWRDWNRYGMREHRYCEKCDHKETRPATLATMEDVFKAYTDYISWLDYFDAVDALDALTVFKWSRLEVDPVETSEYEAIAARDNEIHTYTRSVYAVRDLNAYTTNVLGRTWDYAVLDGQDEEHMYIYYYDAQAQTVIVDFDQRYSGMGGGIGSPYYRGYDPIDGTRFAVRYDLDYQGDEVNGNVFEVEKAGDRYIIVGNYAAQDVPDDVPDDVPTTTTPPTTTTVGSGTTTTTTTQKKPGTTTTTAGGGNENVDVPANAIYTCNFENGLGSWAGEKPGTVEIVKAADLPVANKAGGTQALKFTYNGASGFCYDTVPFTVEPNTEYRITFDVLSNTSDNMTCVIEDVAVGGWVHIVNAKADQWVTWSDTFNSGSHTTMQLGFYSCYIDNIIITKVS